MSNEIISKDMLLNYFFESSRDDVKLVDCIEAEERKLRASAHSHRIRIKEFLCNVCDDPDMIADVPRIYTLKLLTHFWLTIDMKASCETEEIFTSWNDRNCSHCEYVYNGRRFEVSCSYDSIYKEFSVHVIDLQTRLHNFIAFYGVPGSCSDERDKIDEQLIYVIIKQLHSSTNPFLNAIGMEQLNDGLRQNIQPSASESSQ